MNHTYHIITPFSRWQNFAVLAKHLHPLGVVWHPVFDADVPVHLADAWIGPQYCDPCPSGFFPGYWKTNWFFDHHEVSQPDDRYLVLNDDDLYEDGFFAKVDAVDGELLICSMQREGDRLTAEPGQLRCGYVGGEQLIVSGHLMKGERYEPHYEGDWGVISRLAAQQPPVYVPDAVVRFNCLPR